MKNITISFVIVALVIVGGVYLVMSKEAPDQVILMENGQRPVTSGENPQPGSSVHDLPVEPAADLARKDLAIRLSVDEKSIVIMQITDTTWSDGCLGLGGPAESCLQELVPGFKVEMLAKGKTYFYHTDKSGAAIRAETK